MKILMGTKRREKEDLLENCETLCKPKKEGRMDFKELAKFNDAMLAKQV